MGPEVIVVVPPVSQHLASMAKAGEQRLIQAFVTQASVDPKGGEANLSMTPFCCGLPGAM